MSKKNFIKTILLTIFSVTLFTSNCAAQKNFTKLNIPKVVNTDSIFKNPYYDKLIVAISKVESGGNPKAVNPSGKYVGYLQIGNVVVKDCNRLIGENRYTSQDRYSIEKSIEMFKIIQSHYNPTNDIEKAIRTWNGGSGYKIKSTQGYYNKVINHYNNPK